MAGFLYLVRVEQASHSVFNAQDVVVHRVKVATGAASQSAQ